MCQLFDSFVGSTLGYASEIWGFTKSADIERIHLKFCKRLLNVRLNTSTPGVYGELGRYPLYIARYVRIFKYWCKILSTDNIIIRKVYEQDLIDCKNGFKNWVSQVKQMLCNYGFADSFELQTSINVKNSMQIFKQRLIDCFVQEWFGNIENTAVIENYKVFKTQFAYEEYLNVLPCNLRYYITRLRLSAHSLRIQTGRYARNHVPRHERYCKLCNSLDIEDEFHFVCKCPSFTDLRVKYLKPYFYRRPSMYKYLELISSSNKNILTNLAKYIKHAFVKRNTMLITIN
jgi:hypothetical protein